jgi:hypothetical protein
LALEEAGFGGWRTRQQLSESDLLDVPDAPAAYVVFLPTIHEPAAVQSE